MKPEAKPAADLGFAAVKAYAANLSQTVLLARALLEGGRAIDLADLDAQVGLLCAKTLDLPPAAGQLLCSDLTGLLDAVDALTGALTRAAAGAADD